MMGRWMENQDEYVQLAARIGWRNASTGLEAALRAIGNDGPSIAQKFSADFKKCRSVGMIECQAMLVAVADAIERGHEAEIDAAIALLKNPSFPWVQSPAR
jgi:hypothetical protein